MPHTLRELAERFALGLKGDPELTIRGVCGLSPGRSGALSYFTDGRRRAQLDASQASAVVMTASEAKTYSGNTLIADQPQLAFARIAALFDPHRDAADGVTHPTAVIEPDARIGAGCSIGPYCYVGRGAQLGSGCQLIARVHVGHDVRIGARCRIEPGAVIGSRGFGNIPTADGWVAMPQLGSVRIGDDVEIGANTCIDRGTLDDTVIENGVKIDNLVQIAHNVHIGAHTAIAACVGIAGSTRIGARCMIGGACGINGHITIGDGVILAAGSMVTKSLPGPGQYAGPLPAMPAQQWRKTIARLRRLTKSGAEPSSSEESAT